MDGSEQRRALARLIEEKGGDYAGLSRLLAKNPAYIQQFIKRGSPRRLAEEDRRTIAEFFGVDAARLGGPPATAPAFLAVDRLDVGASAGPGAAVDHESTKGAVSFDPKMLRGLGVRAEDASMIRVRGDSMEPTLMDGDEILVDRTPRAWRDGIHVIRVDGDLMVKRLSRVPGGGVLISSDNNAVPSLGERPLDTVDVVGRVLWVGRKL